MTETNLKEILKTLFSADYFDLIENGDIPANWW